MTEISGVCAELGLSAVGPIYVGRNMNLFELFQHKLLRIPFQFMFSDQMAFQGAFRIATANMLGAENYPLRENP